MVRQDCVFCRIVRGESPSFRVYEDARTMAFMDIAPVSNGHVLVVTREHFADLFEVPAEVLGAVAASTLRVARALRSELGPDGLMLAQLNGEAAGQTVFHYHVHLIPRRADDGLRFPGRAGKRDRLQQISEALAARIRAERPEASPHEPGSPDS